MRILFVDDEPRVLEALERMLGLWRLPQSIVDAVAAHHDVAARNTADGALAAAVRTAHRLVAAGSTTCVLGVAA